jgi:hypothetical protein
MTIGGPFPALLIWRNGFPPVIHLVLSAETWPKGIESQEMIEEPENPIHKEWDYIYSIK